MTKGVLATCIRVVTHPCWGAVLSIDHTFLPLLNALLVTVQSHSLHYVHCNDSYLRILLRQTTAQAHAAVAARCIPAREGTLSFPGAAGLQRAATASPAPAVVLICVKTDCSVAGVPPVDCTRVCSSTAGSMMSGVCHAPSGSHGHVVSHCMPSSMAAVCSAACSADSSMVLCRLALCLLHVWCCAGSVCTQLCSASLCIGAAHEQAFLPSFIMVVCSLMVQGLRPCCGSACRLRPASAVCRQPSTCTRAVSSDVCSSALIHSLAH